MKIKKAVIPAAGLGTRFLPITKAMPKEMLPIIDKPTIQFVVEEAVNAGIDDIIIITGRGKRSVEDHFDRNIELEHILKEKGNGESLKRIEKINNMADIHYIRQKEPLGLGHAIYCARKHVGNEPFVVLLGDTILNSEHCLNPALKLFERFNSSIIGVEEIPVSKVHKYGVVSGTSVEEKILLLNKLVEKPSAEEAPFVDINGIKKYFAIFGRYLLTPEIFNCLKSVKPGYGGEIQLTDAIAMLLEREKIYSYTITQKRYDIGKRIQYLKAIVDFALKREDIGGEFKEFLKSKN